ncbi:MAG: hypothetical protein II881_00450 [Oscillospiraceae bacterium]|nr:hypothetical protein [Oscillospiraceae bacterium]
MSVFEDENVSLLIRAVTRIGSEEEARDFLEDILTNKEIISISQRLTVAKMLLAGEKYADIEKATGASSATVVRVNQCIRYGAGGYRSVIEKLGD